MDKFGMPPSRPKFLGPPLRRWGWVVGDGKRMFTETFFFLKFLEDMSPFCGVTDTPILDFW